MIFAMAFFRFFLLGMLEMTVQDNIISGNCDEIWLLLTSAFSSLLFANIIDNLVKHMKKLYLAAESFTAVWLFFVGFALTVDYQNVAAGRQPGAAKSATRVNFFLTSILQIVQTIQLFNWFPKKWLATVICLWLLAP